jgi:hypothetical protein
MTKWLFLLIVIGLGVAGWFYRDKIQGWIGMGQKAEEPAAPVHAPATPNPAVASRAQAVKTYPALGVQGSPFNIRFVQDYNQTLATNPNFLAQDNWPMLLAGRVEGEIPAAAPVATPPPPPPTGVAGNGRFGRPTPTPQLLPGITGTSLDQPTQQSRSRSR